MSSENETSSDESESSHFSLDVGVEPSDDGAWGTGGGGKKRGPSTAVSCIDHCTSRTSNMVVPTLSLCVATEHGTDFNAKKLAKNQDQSRLSIQSAAAGPVYTQQKQQSKKDEVRESISYSDNRDFNRTASTVSRTSNIQGKKAHKKRMQNMDDRLSQLSMRTSNRKLNKIGSYTNFNKNNQAGRAQNNQLSDDYKKQKLLEEQQEQQKIIIQTFIISVVITIITIGIPFNFNNIKDGQSGLMVFLIKMIAFIRLIALALIIIIIVTHWHKIEPAITKILDGETQSGNHGSKKTHKGNNTAVRQSLTNATSVASFMAQSALSAFVEEAPTQKKKKKKKNKKDRKGSTISKSRSVAYSRSQVGGKRSQIGVSRSRL